MTAKMQTRRDTSVNWAAGTATTLAAGEMGLDTTLNQVKFGNGSSAWAALPWLGGSIPSFTSPAITDLNNAANSIQGLYRFASGSGLSNGPTAPIDIKAADGGASMLVLVFGSIVLQQLWTDGDPSQPQKTYSRVFDTAWRAWIPQSSWGVDATEGVDILAKSINVKAIASFAGGSSGAPSITKDGDTDTGIFFPSANSLAITTSGTTALTVGSLGGVTLASNLDVGGDLNMTSGFITNVNDPGSQQGAVTVNYLEIGTRVGATAVLMVDGTSITLQTAGKTTSGLFSLSGGVAGLGNLRSAAGQWSGIVALSTGQYAKLDVNSGSASVTAGIGASPPTTLSTQFHATLIRTS